MVAISSVCDVNVTAERAGRGLPQVPYSESARCWTANRSFTV